TKNHKRANSDSIRTIQTCGMRQSTNVAQSTHAAIFDRENAHQRSNVTQPTPTKVDIKSARSRARTEGSIAGHFWDLVTRNRAKINRSMSAGTKSRVKTESPKANTFQPHGRELAG